MSRARSVALAALLAFVPACSKQPAPAPAGTPEPAPADDGAVPPPREVPPAAEPVDAKDAMELRVVRDKDGSRRLQYPQGHRVPFDERALVPVNKPVRFTIGGDGAAKFEVPAFRITVETKDGAKAHATVRPTRIGEFGVWSDGERVGTVAVVSEEEFEAWLRGAAP